MTIECFYLHICIDLCICLITYHLYSNSFKRIVPSCLITAIYLFDTCIHPCVCVCVLNALGTNIPSAISFICLKQLNYSTCKSITVIVEELENRTKEMRGKTLEQARQS